MSLGKLAAILMVALLVSPSLAIAEKATGLTVFTDDPAYEPGEEVEISGTAEAGLNVTIKVIHDTTTMFHFNITAKGDGNYSDEITLPENKYGTYTVNATQEGVTVQTTFNVVDTSDRDLAHELLREAKKLREHVEEIFEDLEEHGIEIPPEVENNNTLGLDVLALAVADFEDGNYSDAAEEARLALGYFGNAFKLVQEAAAEVAEESKVRGEENEDDVEGTYGLIVAIDRALEYIEKVKATAEKLEAERYEIDEALLKELDNNNTALIDLKVQLSEREISNSDAAKSLAEIRGDIGRIMGLIHSTTVKDCKLEMTERFMEEAQNQIRGIEEKMLRLRERLEAEKFVSVGNSLDDISRKIERLRERLETKDLEDLLGELQGLMDEMDDNLDKLNGEGVSTNLKSMNVVETRINVLRKSAEKLRRKGGDTSDVDEELEAATGLLERMMERLREGDSTEAQNILDEVKEKYEELRGNVELPILDQIKEKFLYQIQKRLQDYTTKISPKNTP